MSEKRKPLQVKFEEELIRRAHLKEMKRARNLRPIDYSPENYYENI